MLFITEEVVIEGDGLPTLEQMRSAARFYVSEAEQILRSDWADGHGPNDLQADALGEARKALAAAKAALDAVAMHAPDPDLSPAEQ